jgi:argininosuccinate lyase
MKLWAGRFEGETSKLVDDFNTSLPFDCRMAKVDIEGSIAHARMLGDCKILSIDDTARICAGLTGIWQDIESGKVPLSGDAEDIHMFVEALLTERIGEAGKRLHTARSRNDQVAVDLRLYLRGEMAAIRSMLLSLIGVLVEKAVLYQDTVMPGYTHLQRAQPITFGHHLMAYVQMLERDVTRLEDCAVRMNECPLGCGALAGTTHPIDRWDSAKALGFRKPTENSLDGVSDRDYAVEFLSGMSLLMMHLSRFSEEIILWCSWEFKFIELSDAYATGSSIMPQKKNPDVAELVRGKTGRVYGSLITLLTVMKSLPLAYNKDMQEDKEPVFDAVDTVEQVLPVFTAMLSTMTVLPENMHRAASHGFINATDCADYLAKRGMPFRDAYKLTGELVHACTQQGKALEDLSLEELQALSPLFGADVFEALSLKTCVSQRKSYGGPATVGVQIENAKQFIAKRSLERKDK